MDVIRELQAKTGITYSDEQLDVIGSTGGLFVSAAAGSGKALPNNTKVLIPHGYVRIDKLSVGDVICGADGGEQTVVGVFPQGQKPVWEIEFSDGVVSRCCPEHLWAYQTYDMHCRNEWKVGSLSEMVAIPLRVSSYTDSGTIVCHKNLCIPAYSYVGQPQSQRAVAAIRDTGTVAEMTCIKVSNPDGLFVIDNFVVTHNTTVMTHMMTKRALCGEFGDLRRVLGITYSKSGATEMDTRLENLFEQFDLGYAVKMKTIHALCFEMLTKWFGHFQLESNTFSLWRDAFSTSKVLSRNFEAQQAIPQLLGLQIGRLLKRDELYRTVAFRESGVENAAYALAVDAYTDLKRKNGVIDFDDLLTQVYGAFRRDPAFAEHFGGLWDTILMDEAQDASKVQFEILRHLLGKSTMSEEEHRERVRSSLVLVGDTDQCIYEWRGSDVIGVSRISSGYSLPVKTLSTNYRCKSDIVTTAAKSIVRNALRQPKTLQSYVDGGSVEFVPVTGGLFDESLALAETLKTTIKDFPDTSKAVLVRNNYHAVPLELLSTAAKISYTRNAGRETGSALVSQLINCVYAFNEEPSSIVLSKSLYLIVEGLNKPASERLAQIIASGGSDFIVWADWFLGHFTSGWDVTIGAELDKTGDAWVKLNSEFRGSLGRSEKAFESLRSLLSAHSSEGLAGAMSHIRRSALWAFSGSPDTARTFVGIVDTFSYLARLGVLSETIRSYGKHRNSKKSKVSILTMHSAKGLEWDTVYLLCDDEMAVPSALTVEILGQKFGAREVQEYLEAERRLHYVAVTRARDKLVVIGDYDKRSRFLKEGGV
jgi:DNA helicase-2/ATP-dependent DNA helicase PcrA